MTIQEQIDSFLTAAAYGVVGASANRDKYGNKCLRCFQQNGYRAIPVNPREEEIEGIPCVHSVLDLPADVTSISVITPPAITDTVVAMAIEKGIRNIWMQPGAESATAIRKCHENNINVIADGSCLLVVLRYHEQ